MTLAEFLRRVAEGSGFVKPKCDEVLVHMMRIISREMDKDKGDGIVIPKFGRFQSQTIGPYAKGPSRPAFIPDAELEARLNADTVPTPDPTPERRPPVKPPPIRAEDREIIERWLAHRTAADTAATTMSDLYPTTTKKPLKFSAPRTIETARRVMFAFCRRCEVPLLQVGLSEDPGELGAYELGALRKEIFAYSQDYQARAASRLDATTPGGRIPSAFRTMFWNKFVLYATDFFEWLIEQGFRPKGANPLAGIARRRPYDLSPERLAIVRSWYRQVLEHPMVQVRERAILMLFSQGLRTNEIITLKLENLRLSEGCVMVDGKGGKQRRVLLFPWVIYAIDRYLESRRYSASPMLFPSNSNYSTERGHINYRTAWDIVRDAASLAFPRPDQDKIRRRIHPHGFRHYYITEMTRLKVHPKALMTQTGHRDIKSLMHYVSFDTEMVEEQVRAASQNPWFKTNVS